MIKVLNLYACLGGNRLKWENCEVTAVELDPYLAELYQERFPNDKVIIADAHKYLLNNFKNFDFIWTSPPCPTHSKVRYTQKNKNFFKYVYPDLTLYEEIIFLQYYFNGKYCVENVIPFYDPLIPGYKRDRHIYWTNFRIPTVLSYRNGKGIIGGQTSNELKKLCEFHEINLDNYKGSQSKIKIARNLVDYEAGLTIYNTAFNIHTNNKIKQLQLL